MMTINANTKIAAILRTHPDAMEAIISISPKFTKLQNPLLRRIVASRTSIATASKIAGCTVSDFFNKLAPLGFEIDRAVNEEAPVKEEIPSFMRSLNKEDVEILDVRPIIDQGSDPFTAILQRLNYLPQGKTLKLINSFEPAPLIQLLGKKGYDIYVEYETDHLVNTYFKQGDNFQDIEPARTVQDDSWEGIMQLHKDDMVVIDVRHLEMPLPMTTILEALDELPDGKTLFVHHKRVPVFLLPELKEKGFEYRIREISEGEVHMLLFKR